MCVEALTRVWVKTACRFFIYLFQFRIPQPRSADVTDARAADDAAAAAAGRRFAPRYTGQMLWGYRPAFLVPFSAAPAVVPQYARSESSSISQEENRRKRCLRILAVLAAILVAIGLLVTIAVMIAREYITQL